jgi:hypothetical protein
VNPRPIVLALCGALCATVALNGCSNSAQSNGTIAGAGDASGALSGAASANPSTSASIPSDLSLDIVMTSTGNAAQDALLTKTKSLLYAYEQAVARANPNDALYQSMVYGQAAQSISDEIQEFARVDQRPIGTIKFYAFRANTRSFSNGVTAADVDFCEDNSQTEMLDSKTGATAPPPTGAAQQSSWDVGFLTVKGKSTIQNVVVRPGGSACTE